MSKKIAAPKSEFDPLKHKRFKHKKNARGVTLNFFALPGKSDSLLPDNHLLITIESGDDYATLTLVKSDIDNLISELEKLK